MGTRADFYVGTGPQAEWLGSVAYDGSPHGAPATVIKKRSETTYRAAVLELLDNPGSDFLPTRPEEGWPWPWEDSRTTDYAYTWARDPQDEVVLRDAIEWGKQDAVEQLMRRGNVMISCFGDRKSTRLN